MSARGAPSPWPATRVGRVAGVSHPHACATPRHHAPAVYARARRVTERDGELVRAVARNRSYKAPIAPPSLRSRARGALYSIRYAYFGWRVSIRLMIHARRNGPGDGPARPDYGLRITRLSVVSSAFVLGAARPRGWPPPRADPRRACACALANRTRSRSYFIACRGRRRRRDLRRGPA